MNANQKQQLDDVDSLTEEDIDNAMKIFLEHVKDGTRELGGELKVFTDYQISQLINTPG